MTAPTIIVSSAAELLQLVGKELGPSAWHELSSSEAKTFVELTQSRGRGPTDAPDFLSTAEVPGHIFLALWPRLVGEVLAVSGSGDWEIEKLKDLSFNANVPVGARLRVRLMMLKAERVARVIQYELGVTFELDGRDDPLAFAVASYCVALP